MGPYKHRYWQLAELTPGSHDVEIQVVSTGLRPVLRGFRESILVRDGPPEAPSMCDFENDPEETLSLRATYAGRSTRDITQDCTGQSQ